MIYAIGLPVLVGLVCGVIVTGLDAIRAMRRLAGGRQCMFCKRWAKSVNAQFCGRCGGKLPWGRLRGAS
jgi:rRNA maturation endonuclease Nob1